MRSTEKTLFELISSVVFNKKTSFDSISKDEISEVYKVSRNHYVTHIISAALIDNGLLGDKKWYALFKGKLNPAMFKSLSMQYALDKCCELFESEHIDYIPLKGAFLRSLYPEPWMRASVDIDILVKREDYDRAADLLVNKLELRKTDISTSHDITFRTDDDTCVELHFDLIEEELFPKAQKILSDVWSIAEPCDGFSHKYQLPMDITYFYHTVHLAKHIKLGGGGIKDFLDLYLLYLLGNNVSSHREMLENGGILPFAEAAEKLCIAWFGDGEHDEISKSLSNFVMTGGLFRSEKTSSIIDIKQKNSKLGYYFSRVFVPYDCLKKQYPIIEKRPYLTPIYGIRRIWSFTLGEKRQLRKESVRRHSKISKKDVNDAKKLFDSLGL